MALKIGIVGLPNVGKSTLFNALLGRRVAAASNYPFCTIDPNVGVVEVPDENLSKLAKAVGAEKTVPAAVEFVDIAGLVKGAHKGEGLGNKFLSHIREVDVVCHVVRVFDDPNVVRSGAVDSKSDFEVVNAELILKDLETLERVLAVKKLPAEAERQALAAKLKAELLKGRLASAVDLTEKETELAREFFLLTSKPFLVVLNVDEKDYAGQADKKLKVEGEAAIPICALIEEELGDLDPQERQEYLQELGLKSSGLDRLIRGAYELLNLLTFYTVKGSKEITAWALRRQKSVFEAAGAVHTDFQKGFIKAEVISCDDLLQAGDWKTAKARGKVRLEGKDYLVKDRDVVEFKFNL